MSPNGNVEVTSAISFPKVTVGGRQYDLKFTFASFFLLNEWGIPAAQLEEWMATENASGRTQNVILKMTAAMIGTQNPGGSWTPLGITPLELAARMAPGEWLAIMQAYQDAVKKVSPGANQPAAIPASEPVQ